MFRLILLFTLLPLVELTLLLRIGEWLGAGPTIALVVLTGVVGAWLARREGLRTWTAVQDELAAGRMPGNQLIHAVLVLAAGIVLVTPGVLTDAAGLLLMIRPLREMVVQRARKRLSARIQVQSVSFGPGFSAGAGSGSDEPNESAEPAEPASGRMIEI